MAILLIASLLALSPSLADASSSFCEQYADLVALNSCPDIPTRDDVVLESYTGRWYEVGVSAAFKLGEGGLSCTCANYTANGTTATAENKIIVANLGLRSAKQGRQAEGRLLILLGQRIGKQMAKMCSAAVQAGITDKVSPIAETIDGLLADLQSSSALALQVNHPVQPSLGEVKRGIIRTAGSIEANIIKLRAQQIAGGFKAGSGAAARFNQALSSMQAATSSLLPLVTSLRPAFVTPSRPFSFYGQAVQNKTYAGKLAVSFNVMPIPGPYWIIRLDGTAKDNYSRAVVITCMPKQAFTVWFLSRSPDVSDQEVQKVRDWLVANNIKVPGYNALVRTNLDSSLCRDYWSALG